MYNRENSVLRQKSYAFALRVIKMSQYLSDKKEYVVIKQVTYISMANDCNELIAMLVATINTSKQKLESAKKNNQTLKIHNS